MKDYVNDCEKELKWLSSRCDHAQIYASENIDQSLTIRDNSIASFERSFTRGTFIDVYYKGKKGSVAASKPTRKASMRALKIAKANAEMEYFYGLPFPKSIKNLNIYDKKTAKFDPDKISDVADDMINKISGHGDMNLTEGGVSVYEGTNVIMNTNGIFAKGKETNFTMHAYTVAEKKDVSTYSDHFMGHSFKKIDPFCRKVRKYTLDFLDAKKLAKNKKNADIIMSSRAIASLMGYTILSNLNGKNVEKDKSIYAGKIGDQIFDKKLTIADNGLLNKGLYSFPFDYEGTPRQKTIMIDKGILKRFIYDHNTGRHADHSTTGNGGSAGPSFTNVTIKYAGDTYHEEELDGVVMVDSLIGSHTANSLTTEFSVKAEHAFYFDKGEKIPIKGLMFSGKFSNLLNNIKAASKDIKIRDRYQTPELLIDKSSLSLV